MTKDDQKIMSETGGKSERDSRFANWSVQTLLSGG